MIARFYLYSVLKNLRFFEHFFVLYLLAPASLGGPALSYTALGFLVGYQKLLTALLEIPLGVWTDRWGRRSALIACFSFYTAAFPAYGVASGAGAAARLSLLIAAQTLFGVAEALRTGSHKAIMLDWLDGEGRGAEATAVVGAARRMSKSSSGASALIGGAILWWSGGFELLFWASTLPAVLGVLLMISYPRRLEGDMVRAARGGRDRPPLGRALRELWAHPSLLRLMLQSVFFESHVKVVAHYTQPFLQTWIVARGALVAGGPGGVAMGSYYLVQDLLAGLASGWSARVERWLGGGHRANQRIYDLALLTTLALALLAALDARTAAIVAIVFTVMLQNVRRPLFVALFNDVMDKRQRATTLSIESQARSLATAALLPLTGAAAEHLGLAGAFGLVAALLALGGLVLRDRPPPTPDASAPGPSAAA